MITNRTIRTLCVECGGTGKMACWACGGTNRKCAVCGDERYVPCLQCETAKRVPFELVLHERVCVRYSDGYEPLRGIVKSIEDDSFVLLCGDDDIHRIPWRLMAVYKEKTYEVCNA